MEGYYGLVEMFAVLLFAVAWGALELYTRRLDRRRDAEDGEKGEK